uniref:NADH dehydrogenase subunit 2 n=1 Tax=Pilargis verrucosa TaxID=1818081 RepID=UPI0030E1B8CF
MNSIFPYIPLFTSTLILGTLMSLSSNQWLFIWMGLEINLLSFVPLAIYTSQNQETEGAIKYFLAQAMGSGLLLLGVINYFFYPLLFTGYKTSCLFVVISLLIKLGMAPCHFWFPPVMASLSWPMCLILSTWQKLIPMSIIIFTMWPMTNYLFMAPAMLSGIIGGLGGINQTQLRPLLAYSSVGHMGWMYAASSASSTTSAMYLLIYILIVTSIMYLMMKITSKSTKQVTSVTMMSPMFISLLTMNLLSLGGLPPFSGFFPKWASIECLMMNNLWPTTLILIISSLMNLSFYLNIFFNTHLKSMTNYKINNNQPRIIMSMLTICSCWLLPLMMLMM